MVHGLLALRSTLDAAWLLELLVKSTLLLAAAGLAAAVLHGARAAVRHAIWSAAAIGLLVLPLVALAPGWKIALGSGRAPLPDAPSAAASGVTAGARSNEAAFMAEFQGSKGRAAEPTPAASPAAAVAAADGSRAAPPPPQRRRISSGGVVVVIWLAGLLPLLAPLVAALFALRKLKSRARDVGSPLAHATLADLRQLLGIGRSVQLLQTEGTIPLAFGMLRPTVLVPTASDGWTAAEWRMILGHELAHIKRCDLVWLWIAQLVRAVYWFHPLAWIACNRLLLEAEKACDEAALAAGCERAAYAQMLLDIAARATGPASLHRAALQMARRSALETRVGAVLASPGPARRLSRRVAAAACMTAALATFTLGAIHAANPAPQSQPATAGSPSNPSTGRLVVPSSQSQPEAPYAVRFSNGATLEVVAITELAVSNYPWWKPDGAPALVERDQEPMRVAGEEPTLAADQMHRTFLFKATGLKEDSPKFVIETDCGVVPLDDRIARAGQTTQYFAALLAVPKNVWGVKLRVGMAVADWQHAALLKAGEFASFEDGEIALGSFYRYKPFGAAAEAPDELAINVAHTFAGPDVDFRLMTVASRDGKMGMGRQGLPVDQHKRLAGLHQITLTFGAMTEEETAGRLFLQHRKIEWANIADVAVNPRFRESVPDPPAGGKGIIAADKESFPNQPGEFYIMGNVGRPGVYSLTGRKITIKQALAAAAMDIEKAKDFEVTLIRRTGASETKATVNVGAILAGDEPDRYLQANDLIQVKRTAATTATAPASRP